MHVRKALEQSPTTHGLLGNSITLFLTTGAVVSKRAKSSKQDVLNLLINLDD
jgi:hypothetical protein